MQNDWIPNYPILLLTCFMVCFLTSCEKSTSANQLTKSNKPNVILVITDDQGYGDFACHGNPYIQTPNLDDFHKEAIRLTDFHVSPTCAPTRAALMTGRYTNRTGVYHTIAGWSLLRENEKTLGNMFAEAGYTTGAFGKWHLGDNYPFRPFDRGFQETVMHGGGGVQQTPDYWNNDYFDDTYFKNGQPQPYQGYCTDVFFQEAMSFIETNQQAPFFCYIATNAPHWPYNVPVEYIEPYEKFGNELLSHQKRFLGMITNIDDNFGKLREQLKQLNIADNTLLIFMSDNGTAAGFRQRAGKTYGFNAGMRATKNHQHDGGHRVPFFIHWKNGQIHGGKDISELSAHIDILPTLAELCGIAPPKNHLPLDGKSLVPLLKENSKDWKERILFTDSQRRQVPKKWLKTAAMTNRWRLVDNEELYDMQKDPSQQNNVINDFPKEVAKLRKAYDNWWQSTGTHFAEEPAIKVGTPYENPVNLTAHDWHTEDQEVPWNQFNIRQAKKGKSASYWTIEVMEAGSYQIQLRRYPRASNLAINATVPSVLMKDMPGLDADIPAGIERNFVKAKLKLNNTIIAESMVDNSKTSVNFSIELPKGKSKFSGVFTMKDGSELGAYYVSLGLEGK
ncbi:MAG: arylsulfatase [Saprospiraceae bacterium]